MSDNLNVEFVGTARAVGLGEGDDVQLKAVTMARIWKGESRRGKPFISLVGDDLAGAIDQLRRWNEAGQPSIAEAKATVA